MAVYLRGRTSSRRLVVVPNHVPVGVHNARDDAALGVGARRIQGTVEAHAAIEIIIIALLAR